MAAARRERRGGCREQRGEAGQVSRDVSKQHEEGGCAAGCTPSSSTRPTPLSSYQRDTPRLPYPSVAAAGVIRSQRCGPPIHTFLAKGFSPRCRSSLFFGHLESDKTCTGWRFWNVRAAATLGKAFARTTGKRADRISAPGHKNLSPSNIL